MNRKIRERIFYSRTCYYVTRAVRVVGNVRGVFMLLKQLLNTRYCQESTGIYYNQPQKKLNILGQLNNDRRNLDLSKFIVSKYFLHKPRRTNMHIQVAKLNSTIKQSHISRVNIGSLNRNREKFAMQEYVT